MSDENKNNLIKENDIDMIENDNNTEFQNLNESDYTDAKVESNNANIDIDLKFKEKAENQVNKILKDISNISIVGSKINLNEESIENILNEIKETTNVVKKQFSISVEKTENKNFGTLNQPISKLIKELKALGDLAQKHSGEFNEDHVKKIFEVLKKKVNEMKKDLKSKEKENDDFSL